LKKILLELQWMPVINRFNVNLKILKILFQDIKILTL